MMKFSPVVYSRMKLSAPRQMEIMTAFTSAYRASEGKHPAIRELACLWEQFPHILGMIEPEDIFAGRIFHLPICFAPQEGVLGIGYCFSESGAASFLLRSDITEDMRGRFHELCEYWRKECTQFRIRAAYSREMQKAFPSDDWQHAAGIAFPLYRLSGTHLDFLKLLRCGLPGLRDLIARRRDEAEAKQEDKTFCDCLCGMLDLVILSCRYYEEMAAREMETITNLKRQKELAAMRDSLQRLQTGRPRTFRDAIQLVLLYWIMSGSFNLGRMDTYLADFYAHDLDSGLITQQEALRLLGNFWKMLGALHKEYDTRVIIGGRGRPNEPVADRFALLAMEATRCVREVTPQLMLRFYSGQNPALMEKALQVIGEGRTYPMLYNDDVNIPAVMKAFNVPYDEAAEYAPFGCGEYVIHHKGIGTPSGVINLLKALEAALNNGHDLETGALIGLETGRFEEFLTFHELLSAYKTQVEYFVHQLALQEALEYEVAGREAAFLMLSLLFDDCVGRNRPLLSGGVRYLGGTVETYGNINTSDSLTAIRQLVYEKRILTPSRMLEALKADFAGFEKERRLMLKAPKYGNDDPCADEMAVLVHEHVCAAAREQILSGIGLHSYLVVVINNSANTILGLNTCASADGRRAHTFMANANNPQPGADINGVTAMLNSLVKLDPAIHAGAVQNMKLSKEMFTVHRDKVNALLDTYFQNGGAQAMINVLSRGDLENAIKTPELYRSLIVRVGGFSARFVELQPEVQQEILHRTMY